MIHHVALEIQRAVAGESECFWALLGFARVDPPPALRDRVLWLERRGTQIHLMYAEDPVAPPHGHVAVVAEDYEMTLARLRDAGHPPDPRAEHWGSPRCFVRCPAGHRVEVMASPPPAAA